MEIGELRQAALVLLLDEDIGPVHGRKARLAKRIGKHPAQVSQWLSGYRTIEEETAREIERNAGKPYRWMDSVQDSAPHPIPPPPLPDTLHRLAELLTPVPPEVRTAVAPLLTLLVQNPAGGAHIIQAVVSLLDAKASVAKATTPVPSYETADFVPAKTQAP